MPEKTEKKEGFPEASFSSLVLMLATGGLQNLGLIPNPLSKKVEKNIPLARHTIDTLGILKKKTQGNLQGEEEKLIDELLYDLQMKYVKISEEQGKSDKSLNG